ncbi:MAG: sulfur carrier protein ThiS [Deltaproteobacteria bacterium]|nr:sulfur carrier protein ThiS [Deltaproteobacteria bacterium]
MRILLNGDPFDAEEGLTVAALLERLGVNGERVAVEVNLEVVRKPARGDRRLLEGDQVEIVSFVGGGQ